MFMLIPVYGPVVHCQQEDSGTLICAKLMMPVSQIQEILLTEKEEGVAPDLPAHLCVIPTMLNLHLTHSSFIGVCKL